MFLNIGFSYKIETMIEYGDLAIVLDVRNLELDSEYTLFTETLGKIRAKATSVRKITSKLAGHLEPGTLIKVRLIRKSIDGPIRLVEALSIEKLKTQKVMEALLLADRVMPIEEKDGAMFSILKKIILGEGIDYQREILKVAGFDPNFAKCHRCETEKIVYFNYQDIIFLCDKCLSFTKNSELSGIYL